MAQRHPRNDRFAQMSKQEELIARKRQEILEKQRTTQLAKAVVAAQNLAAKLKSSASADEGSSNAKASTDEDTAELKKDVEKPTTNKEEISENKDGKSTTNVKAASIGKIGKFSFGLKRQQPALPVTEQPPPKVQNSFTNDGSFLENFKKILETQQPKPPLIPALVNSAENEAAEAEGTEQSEEQNEQNTDDEQQEGDDTEHFDANQLHSTPPPPPASSSMATTHTTNTATSAPPPPPPQYNAFNPANLLFMSQQHQQHQQQQQQAAAAAAAAVSMASNFSTQPPPPPPPTHHQQQQHQHHLQQQFQHQFNQHQHHQYQAQQHAAQQQAQAQAHAAHAHAQAHAHAHALQQAFFANAGAPQLVPPPPPPTTVSAAMLMPMHHLHHHTVATSTPPPPPPPPQLPLALANLAPLYMIPAPEPMQLNAIPAPKEFDLTAIPKPQLNLEAIQVPVPQPSEQQEQLPPPPPQQQQPQQAQQQPDEQQVFSDTCNANYNFATQLLLPLPTTIDQLIDLVAVNGDAYEDKLLQQTQRNQLHPAIWCLYDRNSEQYRAYRQQLSERLRMRQSKELPRSPAEEQQQQPEARDEKPEGVKAEEPTVPTNSSIQRDEKESQNEPKASASGPSSSLRPTSNSLADKYDPESAISDDFDSDDEYMRGIMDRNLDNIKRRIECRNELSEEERLEREADGGNGDHGRGSGDHDDDDTNDDDTNSNDDGPQQNYNEQQQQQAKEKRRRERKSRWGEKVKQMEEMPGVSTVLGGGIFGNQNKPMLSTITRTDPALLQYARLNYGTTQLSEEDWQKCEEHFKVNLLYQDMMRKRQEIDRLARSGKFKYEYDSDEDVDGGTWEHKLRNAEMEATQLWATALTQQSKGKHHIGDFLPPEELKKFMEQYEAKKNNRQPDLSDYKEYKLKEDNIGFQMLQKLGWKEGQGLGQDGSGIVDPVNKSAQREGNQGLGVASASTPENHDNEYDAYRKRMMLAYRFRPNPLNNPRRAYY